MKLPIPEDWDGKTWCNWSVCWPASVGWEGVLRGLLTLPARGWTWDERTGSVKAVQAIGRDISDFNLPLEGCIVGCNDQGLLEIKAGLVAMGEAIQAGLLALANRPCCADNISISIVQEVTQGGYVPYGTEPGLILPDDSVEPPPEGFPTWEDYYDHKCRVANWLADRLIETLRNLGAMQLVAIFVGSLALGASLGGLVAFIPPAAIPLLVAGLLGLGLSITYLKLVGDWLSSNRSDLVCALYNSDATSAAIDAFMGLIDEALVGLAVASSLHPAIKGVVVMLATTDLFNRLFDADLPVEYAAADCSACEPGPFYGLVVRAYNVARNDTYDIPFTYDGANLSFTAPYTAFSDGYPGTEVLIYRATTEDNGGFGFPTISCPNYQGTGLSGLIEARYQPVGDTYYNLNLTTETDLKNAVEPRKRLHYWRFRSTYSGDLDYTMTVGWTELGA